MPLSFIRKDIRRSFLFSASFFFFFANLWNLWCFPPEKSEIRTLFYVFDTQISLNGSKKDGKKKNHRGTYNRTTLSDIRTGYFPRAEGREFASVGLQRYVWTSFFYHSDGYGIFRFSFRDFFLHFPPDPYGIRVFQLKRRAVRSFYFRDFRLDFMGLPGFCGGNEDRVRRTVSYADTVLQAHVQTKASAAT